MDWFAGKADWREGIWGWIVRKMELGWVGSGVVALRHVKKTECWRR